MFNSRIYFLFEIIKIVFGEKYNVFSNTHLMYKISEYKGELFPLKYLDPDEAPKLEDLELFVNTLYRTVDYFNSSPNETDINKALGLYTMNAVLKRTLLEYSENLENSDYIKLKNMIQMSGNVLTHYHHIKTQSKVDWNDDEYRLEMLLRSNKVMVHTIGDFDSKRLKKWLYSDFFMNNYTKRMDEGTLDRYDYDYIVQTMEDDFPNIMESNYCLARVIDTPNPDHDAPLRPCRQDIKCLVWLTTTPSTAYSLTHRLLNILLRHLTRRCYLESKEIDDNHMDLLCAAMYREAVYIARRGFFARDVFMEHVSLCGYRGHLEMFRINWFRKIASWIDEQGCMTENHNFTRNMTVIAKLYMLKEEEDEKEIIMIDLELQKALREPCHTHPMAVSLGAMANAIRYTLYHLHTLN